MAAELYLVRHGQTMFNEKHYMQGWCDAPLTQLGIEQAQRIGRYFEHEGLEFDRAYSSILTRTQQTLECITSMPYERVKGLREWGFGSLEGDSASLMPKFPWGEFFAQHGGESQDGVHERVCRTLRELMEQAGEGSRVLAVSHGSACREFLAEWTDEWSYDRGGVPGNCSVMRFTFDDGAFELVEIIEQEDMARVLGE